MEKKDKKPNIVRKNHVIDATDKSLGRLCTQVAVLLRGKHKPTFAPNVDGGDCVTIINAAKLKVSPKKAIANKYYRYSGYPGGIKSITLQDLFLKNPEKLIWQCVNNMLDSNRLRKNILKRLTVNK